MWIKLNGAANHLDRISNGTSFLIEKYPRRGENDTN